MKEEKFDWKKVLEQFQKHVKRRDKIDKDNHEKWLKSDFTDLLLDEIYFKKMNAFTELQRGTDFKTIIKAQREIVMYEELIKFIEQK